MTPFSYFVNWAIAFALAGLVVGLVVWVAFPYLYCRARRLARARGLLVAILAPAVLLASSAQVDQTGALRQALGQKIAALGTCNAELGQLQQMSAQVLTGQLVPVTQIVAAFEQANPGKTLSKDWKAIDAPVTPEGK